MNRKHITITPILVFCFLTVCVLSHVSLKGFSLRKTHLNSLKKDDNSSETSENNTELERSQIKDIRTYDKYIKQLLLIQFASNNIVSFLHELVLFVLILHVIISHII